MTDNFHVLVVEDDPDVAEYLRLVLVKKAGMKVVVAADVQAATDNLRHLEFDVLLTDIELPGSSGLDLATLARELVPSMSIAVMTAHTSTEHAATARSGRADEFLVKPIRGTTLMSTITALARQGRERRSVPGGGRPNAEMPG